jgi:hypothetical protein
MLNRTCINCGAGLAGGDRLCASCDKAVSPLETSGPAGSGWPAAVEPGAESRAGILASNVAAFEEAPAWRRARPAWLVVALSLATFGLYPYYWLFATWRELKAEQSDERKYPVWHMLAIVFVPIYGLFRFHAHMREIETLAVANRAPDSFSPRQCLLVWMVVGALSAASHRLWPDEVVWFDLLIYAATGGMLVWAQSTLNATWRTLPRGAAPFRVHPWEWVVLVVGGLFVALGLLGSAVQGPPV